ncbi:hypothetical protein BDN67DRAFT_906643, partial [Paxillus ammoniavirescens]
KGNEHLCTIEEDCVLGIFDLTNHRQAWFVVKLPLDHTLFTLDDHIQDELHGALALQAFLLYAFIHARGIVSSRGLAKVVCTGKAPNFDL